MNKSFQTSGGRSHRKSNEFVHLVKCWLVDRAPESRKSWFPIISPKKHDCILTGWHETSVWTELWLRQTVFFLFFVVKDFKTSLVGSLMEDSTESFAHQPINWVFELLKCCREFECHQTIVPKPLWLDWVGCLYVVMGSRQKEPFTYSCLLVLLTKVCVWVTFPTHLLGFQWCFCSVCCSDVFLGTYSNPHMNICSRVACQRPTHPQ